MPRTRPRSTNKAKWSSETLSKAEDLIKKGHSMRYAAKAMDIPFSSLQKRLKKKDASEPRLGRLPVFTEEVEKELAERIRYLALIFYGIPAIAVRKAAYQYAEDNNIKHNFDQSAKMAGRDWLEGFLKRNSISIRKPEATSVNRITGFNKEEVQLFYKCLDELMSKFKFAPKNVYNCDETGISTVQDPGKILAPTGMKRIGSITSWERGKNITLECAMNAAGGFVPPMFVFPRKRMTPLLEKDGPTGAIYKCSDNGWINENLFLEWLHHFANHAKPSEQEPVLLILDNHASHISLPVYDFCKKNQIHMLSLPPHTSHRMQPLDLTFFGPLKAAYKKECDLFLKNRLAEKITPYDVAAILNRAYTTVASIGKGESGFRTAGIVPYNPNVFSDEDFMAAEVLTMTAVQDVSTTGQISTTETIIPIPATPPYPIPPVSNVETNPMPSTSTATDPMPSTSFAGIDLVSEHLVPSATSAERNQRPSMFENLIPLPEKTTPRNTRKGRAKQHATILTSTPLKENLIEKEKKKAARKNKGKEKKGKTQIKKVKRRVLQEKNSSSESDVSLKQICDDDEDDDAEGAENMCIICAEFGRNNELWYRCTCCGLWAHAECTGWDSAEGYVCDSC